MNIEMYAPPHYPGGELPLIKMVVEAEGLASLITVDGENLRASYLPLVWEDRATGPVLLGHMAKANPHWRLLKAAHNTTILFRGPSHYITPAWYPPKLNNVPTWNFAVAQAKGDFVFLEGDEAKLGLLDKQVRYWEPSTKTDWRIPHENPEVRLLLAEIVAFEIHSLQWTSKFKLSQKQAKPARQGVIEALSALDTDAADLVAKFMRVTGSPSS